VTDFVKAVKLIHCCTDCHWHQEYMIDDCHIYCILSCTGWTRRLFNEVCQPLWLDWYNKIKTILQNYNI